jgi:hypothetical protein
MNEEKFSIWALGFAVGVMTVIGGDKLLEVSTPLLDAEQIRAETLIEMYQRGRQDALITNPVSFELEQTCLSVWANKQPEGDVK